MRTMISILSLGAVMLPSCTSQHAIEFTNSTLMDRHEMAQLPLAEVRKVVGEGEFRITDASGSEVAYQITYDDQLIFQAAVPSGGRSTYIIEPGVASSADTVACGAFYPERKDDLTWENDKAAYRAYGPALQASDEHAYGYDIWTKSVDVPIVRKRYLEAFALGRNFHEDHGDGMDVYTVGPTLGGGTAALVDSVGDIVYPWCFSDFEILDNGPLRFTVRLGYESGEHRLISLDAGEFLNRTEVTFPDCGCPTIAPGIVIHRQNPEGYCLSPDDHYMAYADLTDNVDNGNGVIYIGVVSPEVDSMMNVPLQEPIGDALGHILAKKSYSPRENFVYYWGSGWSKGGMPDWQSWKEYLAGFNERLKSPLNVEIH